MPLDSLAMGTFLQTEARKLLSTSSLSLEQITFNCETTEPLNHSKACFVVKFMSEKYGKYDWTVF